MAEVVSVEQDENLYWAMGLGFVQVLINELNETLIENGIADVNERRKMCSRFAFGMGNFLDQYGMEVAGVKRYPLLCFTDKFLNIGDTAQSVEPLHIPARDFEFHGAVSTVVDTYFDKLSEHLEVPIGVFTED